MAASVRTAGGQLLTVKDFADYVLGGSVTPLSDQKISLRSMLDEIHIHLLARQESRTTQSQVAQLSERAKPSEHAAATATNADQAFEEFIVIRNRPFAARVRAYLLAFLERGLLRSREETAKNGVELNAPNAIDTSREPLAT